MILSVVIPIYNVEATLRRCLDSVISQAIPGCELILVDDGSTDDSGRIAEEYANQYHQVVCYHKPNGGLSDARNYGIERAQGQYITFVDSDDALQEDTYRPLLEILGAHPDYDILEYAVLQNPGCTNETLFTPGSHVFRDAMDWLAYKGFEHCWACNKIYKRRLFAKARYPKNRKYEDILILPALMACHPVIATTNRGTYRYYFNSAGIAASDNSDGLTQLLKAQLEVVHALDIDTRQRRFHRLYLNIFTAQLYSYRKTGKILMRGQRVRLHGYATRKDLVKALLLNVVGMRCTCRLFKYFYRKTKE